MVFSYLLTKTLTIIDAKNVWEDLHLHYHERSNCAFPLFIFTCCFSADKSRAVSTAGFPVDTGPVLGEGESSQRRAGGPQGCCSASRKRCFGAPWPRTGCLRQAYPCFHPQILASAIPIKAQSKSLRPFVLLPNLVGPLAGPFLSAGGVGLAKAQALTGACCGEGLVRRPPPSSRERPATLCLSGAKQATAGALLLSAIPAISRCCRPVRGGWGGWLWREEALAGLGGALGPDPARPFEARRTSPSGHPTGCGWDCRAGSGGGARISLYPPGGRTRALIRGALRTALPPPALRAPSER